MVFQINKKDSTNEIIAKLSVRDIVGRVESEVLDIIAVRLADRWIQDNADWVLQGLIDDEKLREDVREIVKKRISNEVEKEIQDSE